MAKRKRLTQANPQFLDQVGGLETKTMFPAQPRHAAPIADVAADAAAQSAVDEMAEILLRARTNGELVISVPLAQIDLDYLVRDRVISDADEMEALLASLRLRGQQTPVELVSLAGGRFGLISGWRRCQALARLHAEDTPTKGATKGATEGPTVLALLRRPAEATDAYLSMVEENEIRVGLSHFERARITLKAVEQGVFKTEKAALQSLFHAASRAKRSKVKSFLPIVRALDGVLQFPEALSERTGLALSQLLETSGDGGAAVRARLMLEKPDSPAAEQALLASVLNEAKKQALNPDLEPESKQAAQVDPPVEPLAGLKVTPHRDGRLTLSGPALTPELRAALMAWLQDQGRTGH